MRGAGSGTRTMASKQEKQRRKAMVHAQIAAQHAREEARLPLPKPTIKALFDAVDVGLSQTDCDHTLRHTIAFLQQHDLPQERVVAWLAEYGGYCDCEVIANVEERWGEVVGSV